MFLISLAMTEPILANSRSCSAVQFELAPRSNIYVKLFIVGIDLARAGRLIFGIVLRRYFEIANRAPVFPELIHASAFLFATISTANRIEDCFFLLKTSIGESFIVITSSV